MILSIIIKIITKKKKMPIIIIITLKVNLFLKKIQKVIKIMEKNINTKMNTIKVVKIMNIMKMKMDMGMGIIKMLNIVILVLEVEKITRITIIIRKDINNL